MIGAVGSWGELSPDQARESETSIPAVFAATAGRIPKIAALEGPDGTITYEELDRRSNRVAAGVLAATGAGEAVGLLFRDGVGFVIAQLGVLKAGRISVALGVAAAASERESRPARARGDVAGGSDGGTSGRDRGAAGSDLAGGAGGRARRP
jgi:non-ribosomal peptide synthetase component F